MDGRGGDFMEKEKGREMELELERVVGKGGGQAEGREEVVREES